MRYDIVIHGGTVITVNPEFEIISDGLICISDGRINRVDSRHRRGNDTLPEAHQFIDATGSVILPGLVNTHNHMPMTLFRGLADDLPLQEWLEENIFPAEAKYINPDSVSIGARLACAEMIMSGTTTCCDGYFLEDSVAGAVAECGLRAVLGQGVIDYPAPGVPDPALNIVAAEKFVDKWLQVSPLIRPSIFCHSPYTCSTATLQAAKKSADRRDLIFQIHVAETRQECDLIHTRHGMTPIQYLDQIGVLDPNTLLVHGVWVDGSDMEIITERGAGVAHAPESNMKLASGVAPIPDLIDRDIPVGLGTDGCASNNNLDLFETMDITAKLHKVQRLDPTTADAKAVLYMATMGGARAIGMAREIGSIEVDKCADLVILDANKPHLIPMYHPVSQVVYSARGSDVTTVIIDGRIVLADGHPTFFNMEKVISDTVEFVETSNIRRHST